MNARFHSRKRSQGRATIWSALVTILLLMSTLSALSSPASAQGTGEPTPAGEEVPAEQPTEAPEPLPTDVPIAPPTEDPNQQPEEESQQLPPLDDPGTDDPPVVPTDEPETPGSIAVNYRVCPAGTDLAATDPATLAAQCTGQQNGILFDLRPALGGSIASTTGDAGQSRVELANVPAVQASLYGASPPAEVFCEGNTSQGNTRPYARVSSSTEQQFQRISLDVAPGEQISCDWYVVEGGSASTGTGEVIIRKNACPVGYNASAHDMLDMAANCQSPAGVVAFSVFEAGGGGYDGGMKQTSGGPGEALNSVEFTGVPNVPLWIYEEVPDGFADPVAFCSVEAGMAVVVPNRYYPWNAGKIELDAPGEGNVVRCHVYNIPSSGSTVTIRKWECPQGATIEPTRQAHSAACAQPMDGVEFTLTDSKGPRAMTTAGGQVEWTDVATGAVTITETIPSGYHPRPFVACAQLPISSGAVVPQPVDAPNGVLHTSIEHPEDTRFFCDWYNSQEPDSTVTIRKWECPQDATIEQTKEAHASACTQPMDGVEFTLTDSKGPRSINTTGGQAQWTDVATGAVTITETIPSGYHPQPFVVCGLSAMSDSEGGDGSPQPVEATNGVLHISIEHPGTPFFCDWYNTYAGLGDVTINKWTCPQGYDVYAWNADPKNDCTPLTNGVTFVLDQPTGVDRQSDTGDSINGAVYFGGVEPGTSFVNEVVPDGIAMVFVLDCVGLNTGAVHPVPLSVGPVLEINVAGGDNIVCDWFNVPEHDPNFGWMTITKYVCWTPTWVSDVDCEIYEDGKTFDLQIWNGSNWVGAASGTTNTAGQLSWTNLDPGVYALEEENGVPCRVEANMLDANDNLVVQANAGTVVKVYNCSSTPPTPGGKMPTKYPNTGVEPVATSEDGGYGEMFSMAGLIGAASMSRRRFLKRAAAPVLAVGAGSLWFGSSLADQTIVPIGAPGDVPVGTPSGTPGADCLFPATPSATPAVTGTPVACARGAVPVHIRIDEIDVDAEMEILETVGGVMQAPTGAEDVAWYKESARLGETGNILLAGHLNYWGVPEGVFFRLEALAEGDAVEIEGDDGETYRYIVEWAENFPSDEEPPEEALGHTSNQSLTLITCGGEWNIDMAEYDHRTVVRAVRDTEASAGAPVATPGS